MPERLFLRLREPGRRDLRVEVVKRLTIGRSRENRCRLKHLSVSREHAVILEKGGRWILYNLAEGNPIVVSHGAATKLLERDEEHPLSHPMSFLLGSVSCEVSGDASSVDAGSTGPGARAPPPAPTVTLPAPPSDRRTRSLVIEPAPAALAPVRDPTVEEWLVGAGGSAPRAPADGREADSGGPPSASVPGATALTLKPEASQSPANGPRPDGTPPAAEATVDISASSNELASRTDLSDLLAAQPRLLILKDGIEDIVRLSEHFKNENDKFTCSIGREASTGGAPVTIQDPSVSRLHAVIEFRSQRFYIRDAGSKTGTRIAGQRTSDIYRVLKSPEALIPGRPEALTPDTHLRLGLVDVVFLSAVDENGLPVDCRLYRTALTILQRRRTITKRQLRAILGRAKKDGEPHLGASALRYGHVRLADWFGAFRLAELYPEPLPPWKRLLALFSG